MFAKIHHTERRTSLKVATKILEKWGCTQHQVDRLLNTNHFEKPENDSLIRASYILSIHSSLSLFFSSKESVYSWVSKKNLHPTLSGSSALDLMLTGGLQELKKIADIAKAMAYSN
ncbi:hypothetical protein L4C42_05285 [Vibrio wakamikoensis]|uniref:hypothetical protein n=1 Tax=Vibrio wakamikoensis TaxID=2910251 RepID=UPI003D232FFC